MSLKKTLSAKASRNGHEVLDDQWSDYITAAGKRAKHMTREEKNKFIPHLGIPGVSEPYVRSNLPEGKSTDREQVRSRPEVMPFVPFPVDVLPEAIANIVNKSAPAFGCDPSMIALPLISTCGAAIGNSRVIRVKHGWNEPPIVWVFTIAESGSLKTPVNKFITKPMQERNLAQVKACEVALIDYARQCEVYEAEKADWKLRRKKDAKAEPPTPPQPPKSPRTICTDVTVEALASRLDDSKRGIMLPCDEASSLFGSFNQYKGGKGGDVGFYLSAHSASPITIDRKGGNRPSIAIARPFLSICGGIQPAILEKLLGREHCENGMLARFIIQEPPRRPKVWTEECISPALENDLASIYNALWSLDAPYDDNGDMVPVVLTKSPEAHKLWVNFYNEHNREQAELTGDLSAAFSKLEAYAPRFAVVLHCMACIGDDTVDPMVIDAKTMAAAIRIVQWAAYETRRVYGSLSQTTEERDVSRIVKLIETRGGSITSSELTQADRRFRGKVEEAEMALRDLEGQGYGKNVLCEPNPSGGRRKTEFRLTPPV